MIFFLFKVIVPLVVFFYFLYRRTNRPRRYSTGVLVVLLLSIIVTIALAQNYMESLMPPPVNDGVHIANDVALYILGYENWAPHWSRELFKETYEISSFCSVTLLILYAGVLVWEKSRKV